MAQYLTYEEYQARGGALDEAAFAAAETRARGRVDGLTHGRVRSMARVPEAVKEAMMTAIGAQSACGADALAASRGLSGFATDGYQESYKSDGERWASMNRAADREILALLAGETDDDGTPLIYAGVGCL